MGVWAVGSRLRGNDGGGVGWYGMVVCDGGVGRGFPPSRECTGVGCCCERDLHASPGYVGSCLRRNDGEGAGMTGGVRWGVCLTLIGVWHKLRRTNQAFTDERIGLES